MAMAMAMGMTAIVVGVAAPVPVSAANGGRDGTTQGRASASCWAIKQNFPASADGLYWLVTPQLVAPQQFWCDMTTDGGGWVLVARGRQGWTFRQPGQGAPSQIRAAATGPAAFTPAAYSGAIIDALLGGGRVSDLPDGIRVRRAADPQGNSWQEVRMRMRNLGGWSWAFNHGLQTESMIFDGRSYLNGNTRDTKHTFVTEEPAMSPLIGDDIYRLFTWPWGSHGAQAGWSYGYSVSNGSSSSDSYLWELADENHAIPFTQVWIRPMLADSSTPIPDTGLPATTISTAMSGTVSDVNTQLQAGVVGVLKTGDTQPEVDAMVLAFAEVGNRIYVGGKFASVQRGAGAPLEAQSYLAAFDRTTGAWIDTFRPTLDGTVWDLAATPSGQLLVAGQFTNVNGTANTSSMALLDPTTGQVVPGWTATFGLTGATTRPLVRSIDIQGSWVYVGGNFTRITGPDGVVRSTGRLARVALSNGRPDTVFRPLPDGEIYSLDAASSVVYIAGQFENVNGANHRKLTAVNTSDGSVVAGVADFLSSTTTWTGGWWTAFYGYQQAVLQVSNGQVWSAGSEHNVDVMRGSDLARQRRFIQNWRSGDGQAIAQIGDVVYVGSHAVDSGLMSDALYSPYTENFSRVDPINRIGAWNLHTTDYINTWEPNIFTTTAGEGAWALFGDSQGCLWAGGDFNRGAYANGQATYMMGFGKFCAPENQPPATPPGAVAGTRAAGGVTVSWQTAADNAGAVKYEVLRNDRVIAGGLNSLAYSDPDGTLTDRYFVRAIDTAGNRSATTTVLRLGDTTKPSVPTGLTATVQPDNSVTVTWNPSTDNVGVTGYAISDRGVEIQTVGTNATTLTGLAAGTHYIQVLAYDAAGNRSARTSSVVVTVVGPDTQKPSVPTGLAATAQADGSVTVTWNPSTDNVGVTGYAVSDAGVELQRVTTAGTTLTGLSAGKHYIQVLAFDAAGNQSAKTASAIVTVIGTDTAKPTVPKNFTAVLQADGSVVLAWTASTDNVAVTGYALFDTGVEIQQVAGTTVTLPPVAAGNHWYQVLAFDAAGNRSAKTASVKITR
jgi:hypothetical protein